MSYVEFPNGFKITSNEAIDARLVMSKQDMVDCDKTFPQQPKYKLPDVYLTVCSDDGKLYLYNKNNEHSEETGRFRVISADAYTEGLGIKISEDKVISIDPSTIEDGSISVDKLNGLAAIAKTGNVNDLVQGTEDYLILNCNLD